MTIFLTSTFKRAAKKLHQSKKKLVEEAIQKIQKNPNIGELKIGDLASVRVYKFRILNQLKLLSYLYYEKEDKIILLSVGPHENFYENLKNQLRENINLLEL